MPRIRYETSGREIEFVDEANLLRLSIRHDGGLPWKCATGLCGTDRIVIVEGAEHLSTPRRRERERLGELLDQNVRLACQTYATGSVTLAWDPDQQGIDEDTAAGKRLVAKWLSPEFDPESAGHSDSESENSESENSESENSESMSKSESENDKE